MAGKARCNAPNLLLPTSADQEGYYYKWLQGYSTESIAGTLMLYCCSGLETQTKCKACRLPLSNIQAKQDRMHNSRGATRTWRRFHLNLPWQGGRRSHSVENSSAAPALLRTSRIQ